MSLSFKFSVIVMSAMLVSACSDSSGGNITLKGSMNTSGLAAVDAASFKLKVYKMAVSTSALCTDLQTVYSNSNPDYITFDGSSIGAANVPNGTYSCIVFEVSDTIKFTPSADVGGSCLGNTEYSRDVCRSDAGGTLIDGSSFTCENSEQRMAIYLSTASTSVGADEANPFLPPTSESDATRGMKLNGAFEVSATGTATFIVDVNDIVDVDGGGECDMQPPGWGFE